VCDREYDKFETERDNLRKTELDAEKNYDTMLTTLSAGALAGCWQIWRDAIAKGQFTGAVWLLLSSLAFVVSLALALLDRKYTFDAHKKWRLILDSEFDTKKWKPGAFERADERYKELPGLGFLRQAKNLIIGFLFVGILLFGGYVLVNYYFGGKPDGQANATAPADASQTGRSNSTDATPAHAHQTQTVNIAVESPYFHTGALSTGVPATQPSTKPVSP